MPLITISRVIGALPGNQTAKEVTMRILLVNPPYRANSIHGMGPQIPLGLLAIGGPLLDAGHEVRLLNAEDLQLTDEEIVSRVRTFAPDAVMTGHSGSTPAHPACLRMLAAIKAALPEVLTIYGGVYPAFHAREILASAPQVDVIVRGEGEVVAVRLMEAAAARRPLHNVEGIAFREAGKVIETAAAPLIRAVKLLREHGIISILSHVAGLADESWGRGWRSLRRLIAYDPDLLNAVYATPHDWTAFGEETSGWAVSEQDLSRWDYRHPVLASPHLRPWQLFLMVKVTELIMHVRPRFLWRMAAHPSREMRRQLRWCWRNAAKVWRAEAAERLFAPGAGATGMLAAPPRAHLPPARGDRMSMTAQRAIARTG